MKKYLYLAIVFAMSVALTACHGGGNSSEIVGATKYTYKTQASINAAGAVWADGAQFALYKAGRERAKLKLTEGAGKNKASFASTKTVALTVGDVCQVYYPDTIQVLIEDIIWPAQQVYSTNPYACMPMKDEQVTVKKNGVLSDVHFQPCGALLLIAPEQGVKVSTITFHGSKAGAVAETMLELVGCADAPMTAAYAMAIEEGQYAEAHLVLTDADGKVAIQLLGTNGALTVKAGDVVHVASTPAAEYQGIIPITANGRTVYFSDHNYGAKSVHQSGTPLQLMEMMPLQASTDVHWHVPTVDELEILFHWTKTVSNDWSGGTPNPDYTWGWNADDLCVTVEDNATHTVLCLPTEDPIMESYTGYYWSSTKSDGDTYMFSVTVHKGDISTAKNLAPNGSAAFLRRVYSPLPINRK